jgi:hypothetical protein
VIVCIVFLFFSAGAFAADLVWPLQKNYGISATFGESRENHYHAGIDLSTNGVTGLPVVAIADGSVYRMKIQKRGYGKALYIRHANGTQSVYAHLEGYSSELGLQSIYKRRAARLGTPYVGDIFLDPVIPVQQGEIVAFSGESGAGLPHLHLEIRKNEVIATNPLTSGLNDSLDPIPPTFQAFYFYPLTSDSAIDGELETKEVRLKKKGSLYSADTVPVVRGDFAVSVSVYDSAARPYHRTPHKLSYSIDDKELYFVEFDQFSYTEPQNFGLLYDLGKPGPSFYEYPILLSRMAAAPLPFVKRSISFSTRDLTPGKHQLEIVAMDTNNNTSVANVPFIVNDPPSFEFVAIQEEAGAMVVHSAIQDPNWNGSKTLSGAVEYSLDEGKSFRPVASTSVDLANSRDDLKIRYRIPLTEIGSANTVQIRARAYDGVEYSPYIIRTIRPGSVSEIQAVTTPAGNLRYETYRGTIRVLFDSDEPVSGTVQLSAGDPSRMIPLEVVKPGSLMVHIPAPRQSGPFAVSLPGGQSLTIPVHYVKLGTTAVVAHDNFRLSLHPNSLYQDSWIWVKSLPAYSSKFLPVIGSMLQLGERGLPFKKDSRLAFEYPENFAHPEKLSIYRWSRSAQRWQSLPSTVKKSSRTVETEIDFLDLYALIYDNVAPKISAIFPKRRSATRNKTPVLAVHIRDSGMDVDEERVTFFVDGIAHKAVYDPDRNVATAGVTAELRQGYHKFYAVAYDYAGNKTQSSPVSFRVK